jgi:hypothetical protein
MTGMFLPCIVADGPPIRLQDYLAIYPVRKHRYSSISFFLALYILLRRLHSLSVMHLPYSLRMVRLPPHLQTRNKICLVPENPKVPLDNLHVHSTPLCSPREPPLPLGNNKQASEGMGYSP